ncbi:MAG: hypothetical protein U0167_05450 [bacterium]
MTPAREAAPLLGGARRLRDSADLPFVASAAGLGILAAVFYALHPGFALGPFAARCFLEQSRVLWSAPEAARELWITLSEDPVASAFVYGPLVLAMALLHWVARRAARQVTFPVGPVVALGFAIAAALSAIAVPVHSADIFDYLAIAELRSDLGLSPYVEPPTRHPDLPALRCCGLLVDHGSIYGSAATRLFSLLYFRSLGVAGFLVVWRAFLAILLGATLLLLDRCWRVLGRAGPERRALLVTLAWSPLVLLAGVMHGHVDVIAGFLVAAGCLQVARGREMAGLVLLAATVCVKVSFVVLLPAILARAFFTAGSPRHGLFRAAGVVAAVVVLYAAFLLPHDLSWSFLGPLARVQGWSRNSLAQAVRVAVRPLGWAGVVVPISRVALVVFLGIGLRAVRDREGFFRRLARDYVVYVVVFSQFFYEWYLLAALVLVVVADDRRLQNVVLLLAATSLAIIHATEMAHVNVPWLTFALYAVLQFPATVLLLLPRPSAPAALAGQSTS